MNHRERVRQAISHQEPDRLPIDFGGTFLSSATPEMQRRIADLLGLRGEPDPRFKHFDERIQRHFDTDLRSIEPAKWPTFEMDHGSFAATIEEPTLDALERYPWPEPEPAMIAGLRDEARFLHEETDYFICASQIGQGIFELGCYLRGYANILEDMVEEPDFVHAFNRRALETNRRLGEPYFGAIGPYVDMVLLGDDLATQRASYMSPRMFREFIKPYFAEYIRDIRALCPNAVIAHHCCGASYQLLDDLIEIGVQVSNPTQTTAEGMAPERLALKKPRLTFHGGVDLQHVLPHGTRAEVRAFVKNLIEKLAPGGGYILAACHTLPDDVRPENVIEMIEAARELGHAAGSA
jgi:uroporphyrinogen decarboxylase